MRCCERFLIRGGWHNNDVEITRLERARSNAASSYIIECETIEVCRAMSMAYWVGLHVDQRRPSNFDEDLMVAELKRVVHDCYQYGNSVCLVICVDFPCIHPLDACQRPPSCDRAETNRNVDSLSTPAGASGG